MMKTIRITFLAGALIFTAWLECSILKHAGVLWGLFFGGFFFLPWATAAAVAMLRRTRLDQN